METPRASAPDGPTPDADFIATFNACAVPKEVVRAAQADGLSPEEAARRLYEAEGRVSVELLGACLGNHADFCKELARAFPTNFSCFAGMDLVPAIRAYLWRFRLPGEAAQIERVIDGFARAYFAWNRRPQEGAAETVPPSSSPWEAGAQGWYVIQPRSGPDSDACCVHCGALSGQDRGDVHACQGCGVVHFCRKCRKLASRRGHAVVGMVGYGRACVAARRNSGLLTDENKMSFQPSVEGHGPLSTKVVDPDPQRWARVSPFQSQDAVMVLAYAIIMLTTNLHSAKVKQKMAKHEFLQQNREVNGGENFPGDFLSQIYDDIQQEELTVMRNAG